MNGLLTQFDAGAGYTGDVTPQASTLAYPEDWMFDVFGGWGRTETGETVNPKTARGHGPVWAAINTFSGDVGQLPMHVSRLKGRDVERADEHPLEWLLAHEPNQYQTPATFKETMMGFYAGWGNCCAWIVRDGAGRPMMLVPLLPDRTRPIDVDGEWWIETDFGDGKRLPLPYEDVFHLPWQPDDAYAGFWGIGPIQACKNVIACGMSIRKHGSKTFSNGGRPGGALEIPGPAPTPEVMREKREQLEAMHGGAQNAGKWLMLYHGVKFAPIGMNNHDAQWLEALDLDRDFIAMIFGLPPYKLGSMKNSSTRANTEQQQKDYLNNSLGRHLNKFREEVRRKLFTGTERRMMKLDVDWTYEAFLRNDQAARGAFYSQAITGEWMTPNEVRKLEGLNPLPGGDVAKNPAINPARETPKEPSRDESGDNAKNAVRAMILGQVSALLDTEANTVEKNVPLARNVPRWIENYYDKYLDIAENFLSASCATADCIGCKTVDWKAVMSLHAKRSMDKLQAMVGIASKDSLPRISQEFASSIRDSKGTVAASILGD